MSVPKDVYERWLAETERRIGEFDKIDGGGQAGPVLAATALSALESGLGTGIPIPGGGLALSPSDLSCLLDAVVYLRRLVAENPPAGPGAMPDPEVVGNLLYEHYRSAS